MPVNFDWLKLIKVHFMAISLPMDSKPQVTKSFTLFQIGTTYFYKKC